MRTRGACSLLHIPLNFSRSLQEITSQERLRWWTSLLLRPGAALVVCRIGVLDSALLAMERKDVGAVLEEDAADAPSRIRVRMLTLWPRMRAGQT